MWDDFFENEMKKDYFLKLKNFIDNEYRENVCYPEYDNIFNAYKYSEPKDIKAVILGQDPYHNPGEAHGLSFSIRTGKVPPSLKNIYKEMESDLNVEVSKDGDLTYLAEQGVFLLNTILTVRKNKPLSHKKKGWEEFTLNTIKLLNNENHPIVFILWGNEARKLKDYIDNPIHLVIEGVHPSPLSAYNGFFGSKPFSGCNKFLVDNDIEPIKWYKEESHFDLFHIE